jgi:diguanylate cyclase (GGDEF)-like protein
VQISALTGRGSGLVATVVAVLGWAKHPANTAHAAELVVGGVIAICLMATALIVSALAFRLAARPSYAALGHVAGVLDCSVITAAVVFFTALEQSTSWPMLVIPILVAGYSRHTLGAILMWLLTAGSYAVGPWLISGRPPADLPMAAGLLLVIGLASGTHGKAFARQVEELHAARAALRHQASHDALTGLANRSLLAERAAGFAGERVAVLVLDLDHFKAVNDSMGHAAGDELLRVVAQRLARCIGPRDVASRVGGDEFIVLLVDTPDEDVAAVAGRIRTALAEPVDIGGIAVPVYVSIGAAHREAYEDLSLETMTEHADLAMYADKAASRRPHPKAPAATSPAPVPR